jgi:hypothetical protein
MEWNNVIRYNISTIWKSKIQRLRLFDDPNFVNSSSLTSDKINDITDTGDWGVVEVVSPDNKCSLSVVSSTCVSWADDNSLSTDNTLSSLDDEISLSTDEVWVVKESESLDFWLPDSADVISDNVVSFHDVIWLFTIVGRKITEDGQYL